MFLLKNDHQLKGTEGLSANLRVFQRISKSMSQGNTEIRTRTPETWWWAGEDRLDNL